MSKGLICMSAGTRTCKAAVSRILFFSPRRRAPPSSGEEEETMGERFGGQGWDATAEKKTLRRFGFTYRVTTSSHVPRIPGPDEGRPVAGFRGPDGGRPVAGFRAPQVVVLDFNSG
jgi:hypothetical protein